MKKWELESEIERKDSYIKIVEQENQTLRKEQWVNGFDNFNHVLGDYRIKIKELEEDLKNQKERITHEARKYLDADQKNFKLQNEIKKLKGLKKFVLNTTDTYGYHEIHAEDYYESNDYTVFTIKELEIFKIKSSFIVSLKIEEF